MSLDENERHAVLQDISVIARKALEDTEKATESDWSAILSCALEAIVTLCQREQDDVEAYHYALNSVLPLFVFDRGFDYNCVDTGLKALARHPELPTDAKMAAKIREMGLLPEEWRE